MTTYVIVRFFKDATTVTYRAIATLQDIFAACAKHSENPECIAITVYNAETGEDVLKYKRG